MVSPAMRLSLWVSHSITGGKSVVFHNLGQKNELIRVALESSVVVELVWEEDSMRIGEGKTE